MSTTYLQDKSVNRGNLDGGQWTIKRLLIGPGLNIVLQRLARVVLGSERVVNEWRIRYFTVHIKRSPGTRYLFWNVYTWYRAWTTTVHQAGALLHETVCSGTPNTDTDGRFGVPVYIIMGYTAIQAWGLSIGWSMLIFWRKSSVAARR